MKYKNKIDRLPLGELIRYLVHLLQDVRPQQRDGRKSALFQAIRENWWEKFVYGLRCISSDFAVFCWLRRSGTDSNKLDRLVLGRPTTPCSPTLCETGNQRWWIFAHFQDLCGVLLLYFGVHRGGDGCLGNKMRLRGLARREKIITWLQCRNWGANWSCCSEF